MAPLPPPPWCAHLNHTTASNITQPTQAKDDGFYDAHPTLGRVSSANSLASDLFVDAQEDQGPIIPPPYQPSVPSTTLQDVMRAVAMGQTVNPAQSLNSAMQQSKSTSLSKVDLIAPSDSDEWLNDLLGTGLIMHVLSSLLL